MRRTAKYWIKRLRLRPHPEGGYYRETYRAPEIIAKSNLPKRYKGKRALATAIYFLLRGNQYSAFHRLKSDEIWHFYDGAPISIFMIEKSGRLTTVNLGLNAEKDERPQYVIISGSWFAAALVNQKSQNKNREFYALLGCTVAPGFDFADFELGDHKGLCRKFPQHRLLITKLTGPNVG